MKTLCLCFGCDDDDGSTHHYIKIDCHFEPNFEYIFQCYVKGLKRGFSHWNKRRKIDLIFVGDWNRVKGEEKNKRDIAKKSCFKRFKLMRTIYNRLNVAKQIALDKNFNSFFFCLRLQFVLSFQHQHTKWTPIIFPISFYHHSRVSDNVNCAASRQKIDKKLIFFCLPLKPSFRISFLVVKRNHLWCERLKTKKEMRREEKTEQKT